MQSNKPCLEPNYCWDVFNIHPLSSPPLFAAPHIYPSIRALFVWMHSQSGDRKSLSDAVVIGGNHLDSVTTYNYYNLESFGKSDTNGTHINLNNIAAMLWTNCSTSSLDTGVKHRCLLLSAVNSQSRALNVSAQFTAWVILSLCLSPLLLCSFYPPISDCSVSSLWRVFICVIVCAWLTVSIG